MKKQITLFVFLLTVAGQLTAQNFGRLIVRNAGFDYPGIIVSLNGVRLSNEYKQQVIFDYLDEGNYRVKILQAGSAKVLMYNVDCSPNYISRYILDKDNYGNYTLVMESKSLLSAEPVKTEPVKTEPVKIDPPKVEPPKVEPPNNVPPKEEPVVNTPGPQAMPDKDFQEILKSIKKESLESTRLQMAKTFFNNQQMSSAQVTSVMKSLSLESSRLQFAKFAYGRTVDKNAFFKTFDAFTLSSSKREMSDYIKANP